RNEALSKTQRSIKQDATKRPVGYGHMTTTDRSFPFSCLTIYGFLSNPSSLHGLPFMVSNLKNFTFKPNGSCLHGLRLAIYQSM
ncbi:hypothetical protein, partial [Hallella faecis]|uniref:hypothetical protein n=1 Tax=Hallella faecis TaxID=2841596 RepID=UPI001C041076